MKRPALRTLSAAALALCSGCMTFRGDADHSSERNEDAESRFAEALPADVLAIGESRVSVRGRTAASRYASPSKSGSAPPGPSVS